jgi:hypothetical protein
MENINTGLRVGQAISQNNGLGAITALAGNSDIQSNLGLGSLNVGGVTAKDALTFSNLATNLASGSPAALGNLISLVNSSTAAGGGTKVSDAGTSLVDRTQQLYDYAISQGMSPLQASTFASSGWSSVFS